MKVTKITVGRLYNLGNYEHIRYELSVELNPSDSAQDAMLGIENILTALNPVRPTGVSSEADLRRAEERVRVLREETSEDECAQKYGKCKALVLAEWEKKLEAATKRTGMWEEHRTAARAALDDVGGASEWKDAKREWEFDDEVCF